jgi:hypothetical protein
MMWMIWLNKLMSVIRVPERIGGMNIGKNQIDPMRARRRGTPSIEAIHEGIS